VLNKAPARNVWTNAEKRVGDRKEEIGEDQTKVVIN